MLAALVLSAALGLARPPHHASGPTTVTIVYDAFGGAPDLVRDWGFAALIEYQGKRILFDTGNNAANFAQNVRRLHIDLKHLDLVVVSHRHSDHTAGLSVVLQANPNVPIYAPREGFGIFGSAVPGSFYRALPTLPDSMRYFEGVVPDQIQAGTVWPTAHFVVVDTSLTIAPGIRLVATVSETPARASFESCRWCSPPRPAASSSSGVPTRGSSAFSARPVLPTSPSGPCSAGSTWWRPRTPSSAPWSSACISNGE